MHNKYWQDLIDSACATLIAEALGIWKATGVAIRTDSCRRILFGAAKYHGMRPFLPKVLSLVRELLPVHQPPLVTSYMAIAPSVLLDRLTTADGLVPIDPPSNIAIL